MTGEVLAFAGMAAAACGGIVVGRRYSVEELQRQRDNALRRLRTDELTGLPNRLGLYEELERREAAGEAYTAGLLDLDHFKAVNDHFGHDEGDDLLIEVGNRLRHAIGARCFPARLHGDEFVFVLPAMSDDQAATAAWLIKEHLAAPWAIGGHYVLPWASIGMSHAEPGDARSEVLHRADVAMYRAKRGNIGIAVFDPTLDGSPQREQDRPTVRLRDMPAAIDPDRQVAA